MSNDPLVPVEKLVPHRAELLRRISKLDSPIEISNDEAGEALARALLFEHWPDLVEGEHVDPVRAFYNRYYWFRRFVTLAEAKHGPDAGLEQQLFKMLEYADHDVDWELVEQLDQQAKQG